MAWSTPRTWVTDEIVTATNMNTYISDNLAFLAGMKFANVAISSLAAGTSAARVATGTYTGNASATKAITGVGFQPKAVFIIPYVNPTNVGLKTDQDGTFASAISSALYAVDLIISLDSDGFTVGDGTGSSNVYNVNTRTYLYLAFG